jgi:hypothetical protein
MSPSDRSVIVRDRFCLFSALIGYFLWLASVSVVRIWAARTLHRDLWIIGVAPNFLAACTFSFLQAFATRSSPFQSVAYATVLVTVAEVIQLYIPGRTFDKWDVAAGIIGAATAMPVLLWRERLRALPELNRCPGDSIRCACRR